jgi:hypothetical protein
MSEVGRYRRAYPRLFRHPGFKKLTPLSQRLVMYVLLGPQSNRIGLFYFSISTAAEDLDTTPGTLRKALSEITASFGWSFDAIARVFFIPTWWKFNHPDHENVLRGNLKDLNEVPPCALTERFATNLIHLHPKLHQTFVEACGVGLGKAPRGQEQKQKQEQEQKQHQEQEPYHRTDRAALTGVSVIANSSSSPSDVGLKEQPVAPLSRFDWFCPHQPPCSARGECHILQKIDLGKELERKEQEVSA